MEHIKLKENLIRSRATNAEEEAAPANQPPAASHWVTISLQKRYENEEFSSDPRGGLLNETPPG